VSEGRAGDQVDIDRFGLVSGGGLDGNHPLLLGLVGEGGAADEVADREDALRRGALEVVDLDLAAIVGLHAGRIEVEGIGVGAPPTGDHQIVGLDLLIAGLDLDARLLLLDALDLRAGQYLHAVLLELALHHTGHVLVLQGEDLLEHLDQGHLDSHAGVGGGDLRAGRAGAGDHQRFGHRIEGIGAPGVDHPVREVDSGNRQRDRSGGDHDRLGLVRVVADLDVAWAGERRLVVEELDLILVPEELDAVLEGLGDLRAALLQPLPIDRGPTRLDAEVGAIRADRVKDLGSVQDRLGRDAGVIQAAPARLVPLDDCCLLTQLGGTNGGHVTARAASDHDHVVLGHLFDSIGGRNAASRRRAAPASGSGPSHGS
jgi:hypothetical protein